MCRLLTRSARLRLLQLRAPSIRPETSQWPNPGSVGVLLDALHERVFQGHGTADQCAGGRRDCVRSPKIDQPKGLMRVQS